MIDPFRFARIGEQLEKKICLTSEGQLQGVIAADSTISLFLEGGRHENKRFILKGNISGKVIVRCQVCLEKLEMPLDIDFEVFPVKSEEQADRLSEEFEPMVIEDDILALKELVTNELILSMPVVFSHLQIENKDCANQDNFSSGKIQKEKKVSPFAILKSKK